MDAIIHIQEGRVINDKVLKSLPDGAYELKKKKRTRTLPMNAYLHGVLIPEFREALKSVGYNEVKTDEQAKLIIKSMFLKRQEVNHQTGECIEWIQDTHNLTTIEMTALFDEVISFAQEHMNYTIQYPSQQSQMFY